jgi:hypothetical protein
MARYDSLEGYSDPQKPPRITAIEKLEIIETLTFCIEDDEPIPRTCVDTVRRLVRELEEEAG